jgi:hypothetical protein
MNTLIWLSMAGAHQRIIDTYNSLGNVCFIVAVAGRLHGYFVPSNITAQPFLFANSKASII